MTELNNVTNGRQMNGIVVRTIMTLLLIPVALIVGLHPSLRFLWTLFCVGLGILGIREFFEMVKKYDVPPNYLTGTLGAAALCLVAHLGSAGLTALTFAAILVCGGIAQMAYRGPKAILSIGGTFFGLLYVPFLGSHVVLIRSIPNEGASLLLLFFGIIWMNDIGAYLVGTFFGKHKIIPHISPNKTYEGGLGGLAAGILTALVLGEICRLESVALFDWTRTQLLVISLVVGVLSQLGDFFESYLKRDAGVKDSGTIIPGHGGILDRIDGMLFAAPALYYFATQMIT